MWTRFCGISLLGVLAGCSIHQGRLRPEPSEAPGLVLSGGGRAATLETQEVRFTANGDAWNREPWDLARYVTPVRVTLENYSGRALRIQYANFELQGEARYVVLPPRSLTRDALESVTEAAPPRGSAPRCLALVQVEDMPSPPPLPEKGRPEVPAPPEYSLPPTSRFGPVSGDVLRLSVKEGVLKHGGRMSGFLYFQNVGAHERRVTLQARLVDADTGETFTTLRIPFQVLGSSR